MQLSHWAPRCVPSYTRLSFSIAQWRSEKHALVSGLLFCSQYSLTESSTNNCRENLLSLWVIGHYGNLFLTYCSSPLLEEIQQAHVSLCWTISKLFTTVSKFLRLSVPNISKFLPIQSLLIFVSSGSGNFKNQEAFFCFIYHTGLAGVFLHDCVPVGCIWLHRGTMCCCACECEFQKNRSNFK